jgi:hypothetical protein
MRTKKILPFILLIVLALLVLTVKNCKRTETNQTKQVVKEHTTPPANNNEAEPSARGLNRHPFIMNYSKHAKCRMECRHIDESEIKDILEHLINMMTTLIIIVMTHIMMITAITTIITTMNQLHPIP